VGVVSGCLVSSFVVVSKIERFPQKARTFPLPVEVILLLYHTNGWWEAWSLELGVYSTYRLTSINDKCHYYVWLIILRKFIAQ
jgi:hypothetical protein